MPLVGKRSVAAVTRADVERMMHAIAAGATARQAKTKARGLSTLRGGRGAATRTVSLLGGVFAYAVARGLRPDNPVHGVRKYAENRRERRLTDEEYALLGAGLRAAEATVWPPAVSALRFLVMTGWRSSEAIGLRWGDVDLSRRVAVLPDTKTGRSVRPLSRAACELLAAWPRRGDSALVFQATRGDGPLAGFQKFAVRILAQAGLPADVTPHTLRHSFVSLGADLGFADATLGALVGHKTASITGRYTHLADAPMLAAADRIAAETLARTGEATPGAVVVPLRPAGVG